MARLLLLSRRHSRREYATCDVCQMSRPRVVAKFLVEINNVIAHRFSVCRACLRSAAAGATDSSARSPT